MNLCFLSIITPLAHTKLAIVLQPLLTHKGSFFACWFTVDMKYCPTTHLGCVTLHLCLFTCFCKLSNLGTKSFSCPSISLQTLQHTIVSFPSHLTTTLDHGSFVAHLLKNKQLNFHSHFLFFLFWILWLWLN
jgi:hypothetical protein